MSIKRKAIFLCDRLENIDWVYGRNEQADIRKIYELPETVYCAENIGKTDFSDVEAIFSTWGMPTPTEEEILTCFPNLKYVFYAAGTVQSFARPFLKNGVRIFSAWRANAIPVAEFTVAQILLANKGYFQLSRKTAADYRAAQNEFLAYRGNYGTKVGILGDGAIGTLVIDELLRYNMEIYVFSITMTEEQAQKKGVHLCSMKEIFSECDVISNHLANNEATQKIINRDLLSSMKPYATFINTGRGAQVDEDALADVLAANKGITALLDVTDPEPPMTDSPLNKLENVFLTPHIAGSSGNEVCRMAAYMADNCKKMLNGEPSCDEVTLKMLEGMA